MSRLVALPPELVLNLSHHLEYTCDLNSLAQTCSLFYSLPNDRVYQRLHNRLRKPPPTCRYTGLHWAAENGKDLCVRTLMRSGISANMFHDNGRSPLLLAAAKGHTEVVRIFLYCGVSKCKWLDWVHRRRATPESTKRGNRGQTPVNGQASY